MESILADRSERLTELAMELARADSNKKAAAVMKKIRKVRKTMNLVSNGIMDARRNEFERNLQSLVETSNAALGVQFYSGDEVTEEEVEAVLRKIIAV